MEKDQRKKGCPNESCEMHKKKVKQKSEIDYCPKCGTKNIMVCSKCFKEIEDIDNKHRICELCEAKAIEKREQAIEQAKGLANKAGKSALYVATAASAVVEITNKVVKNNQPKDILKSAEAVEKIAKALLRK